MNASGLVLSAGGDGVQSNAHGEADSGGRRSARAEVSLEAANRISRGANQQQYNRFEVKKLNGTARNRKKNDFFRKL